jgi:hypothetical protein
VIHEPVPKFKPGLVPPFDRLRPNGTNPFVMSLSNHKAAAYVDTVEDKAIIAIRPKPAFQALFQVATTKEGSGVVLYNEKAFDLSGSSDDMTPCFWWRRGRVELHRNTYLGVLLAAA